MYVVLTRLLFVIVATGCGYWLGYRVEEGLSNSGGLPDHTKIWGYTFSAFLLSLLFVVVEHNTNIVSSKKILLSSVGFLLGLITAALVATTFPNSSFARPICNIAFGYLGIILALKHADRFNLSKLNFLLNPGHRLGENSILLDTNIIIDGRIKELLPTGFLAGTLIIPEFVLDELQILADSNDSQRRIRGKRGFAMLEYLRASDHRIEVYDVEYPNIKDVDHKLLRLALDIGAKILTNDNNLRAISEIQGVEVLNINDLTNAVRPVAHVGEMLRLEVIREGKESTQGIGYLEDGTMVVVDDGVHLIGSEVEVTVTSVLQTSAGRMIFSRAKSVPDGGGQQRPRNGGRRSRQQAQTG